jgi:DNA-binding FadR family transcriptional regulator
MPNARPPTAKPPARGGKKKPVSGEALVARLAKRILSGAYPPGTSLPREIDLSEELGVGRPAIREAIRTLTAKGMVEPRKRFGTRVRPTSDWVRLDEQVLNWQLEALPRIQLIRDVLDMRRVIEPAAAELTARQGRDEELALIERAFRRMEAAAGHDAADYADADLLFHRTILTASGNALLGSMASFLTWTLKASFGLSSGNPGAPFRSLAAHRAVLDALWRRDSADAREKMLVLIETANDRIQQAER